MLSESATWLDAGPTWLGFAAGVCVVLAARADWAGAGPVPLAVLASVLALAFVQAMWSRPRRGAASAALAAPAAAATPVAHAGVAAAPAPAGAAAAHADALPAPSLMRSAGVLAPGLDIAQVLDMARSRFLRLQAAWDAGDVAALRSLTTPDMLAELLQVLDARLAAAPCRTDVVSLHAELLGLEELGAAWLASVEFSGLIRESAEAGAVPFRELWMLSATKDGTASWRLARQQALL